MTPVDTPWHFTTWLDALDHWQTGLAGLAALLAAIIAVWVTLRVERRKADREVDALRKSLAVELRQQIPRALAVYDALRRWSSKPDRQINVKMVEHLSRMPAPIIFSANAGKIGLLEGDAMDVVIVYALLESARDGVDRLRSTYMTPDDIEPVVIRAMADGFLAACEHARGVLPRLRTGVASADAEDEAFITTNQRRPRSPPGLTAWSASPSASKRSRRLPAPCRSAAWARRSRPTSGRAHRVAGGGLGRPARSDARAGRELFRGDFAAGIGKRLNHRSRQARYSRRCPSMDIPNARNS